jgi:TonB-dependent receptor
MKYRDRTKQTDVDEFDFSARSAPFNRTETLANFTSFVPQNTNVPLYNAFPVLSELNPFLNQLRSRAAGLANVLVNSNREDFESSETVLAGYAMGVLEPSDGLRIITGARIERTKFRSDGNFVFDSDGSALPDATVANPSVSNEFTDILPTLLVRYEASSDLLVRGSFNMALQRPNFEDTRNVHSALDDGTTRSLELQNPLLDPAKAMQFDASVAWYPNRNTGLTLGVFYKRIRDFIVDADFLNVDIRNIPGVNVPLPTSLPGGFVYNNVEVPVNGDVGKIWGAEFSYSQNFTFLPKPLNGLFAVVSATWADSKAQSSVRTGSFVFPGQPKWVVNGSLGYEDKGFSIRGAMTYRDEVLDSIASTPVLDRIRPAFTSFDIDVRFNITDAIQLYADAINITGEQDERYYRGDANGGFFNQIERYGRTFQLGVRASF